MSIILNNSTKFPAQFTVMKGQQLVENLPGVAPGASVSIPTNNTYTVTASTTIENNVYTSAPLTVDGTMGFQAQVIQDSKQGTYVFNMVEVPSTAPNQLQFQKTCLNDATFSISKDGSFLQAINVSDNFNSVNLTLSDTFSIVAVVNGVTTSAVETGSANATVTAIIDTAKHEAGYFTLTIS